MPPITARAPRIDWRQGFARHWNAGDAAATHAFDAMSFLFPQGEVFFIDVARKVAAGLDLDAQPALREAVRDFIAQESIHTHQHRQYNEVLERLGYANVAHDLIERIQAISDRRLSLISQLAVVCAYEHYTAVLGNLVLNNPRVLASAEPAMALIWGWHSAEETEHKSVCFDLYSAAGGGWFWRATWFLLVTLSFTLLFSRVYLNMLYRDGCFKPRRIVRTGLEGLRFFFGRCGVVWHLIWHGLPYLSPRFHPWRQDNRAELTAWLSAHEAQLRAVGHGAA